MKKRAILAAVFIGLTFSASSAFAGPATDALTACLADNTTGKDRKDMARWIFAVMSVHPDIMKLANVSETDRDKFDRSLADIVTRLLTQNCQVQVQVAMEKEKDESPFVTAFGEIGRLAMQELVNNPGVNSATKTFVKYLDEEKLSSTFTKK